MASWRAALHRCAEQPVHDSTEAQNEEYEHGPQREIQSGIPRFFVKKKVPSSELAQKFGEAAYAEFISFQRNSLLSNEELDILWDALLERATGETDEERQISYADFDQINSTLPAKFRSFFKPSCYMRFVEEDDGTISVLQFFNYVLRKVSLLQARLDLSVYDDDRDGYLTEEDLQRYVADLIPSLNLHTLSKSFHKFYLCTASRKFGFFLDPMRRGKIGIQNILLSPILTELFELREPELPKDYERSNWFSAYSSLRVYGQFLNLDTDRNGMLSRSELGKYNSGSLTDLFLDRVFQECQTYGGEMDYRTFLDFVLAVENIQTPEAISYCFRMLDIKGEGYLDEHTIMYFFKAVADKMMSMGHETVGIRDVKNEVFDMANPQMSDRITLTDLIKCGVGGTIIKMLCDVQGFWSYETREVPDPSKTTA
ncbi:uncharacterized protein SPPG_02083 [Spizellomyces punctatus DAOM BR117]|uniref:EF-hand domain-containing protein n=1 Tax=Spizellomyces punctatus (strain DAOM BR117) TaxID=645134 RepID=A0A0L0HPK1_SPIPD|nr:uncharacterized protein SPPG_02083 [Spizellomyces punctatus DAOM BR117]KND03012.1 hypothetical protein SPPG_02083 [Spizellomyces punctatus DAOM BR117]|eukprot:XP_016611051.1 hypothetical protein SPPG_02083 [Spizellomyces punctatus DAOM BR117]